MKMIFITKVKLNSGLMKIIRFVQKITRIIRKKPGNSQVRNLTNLLMFFSRISKPAELLMKNPRKKLLNYFQNLTKKIIWKTSKMKI